MNYTTLKFRIKDSTTKRHLQGFASAVNRVWNYCNEVSISAHGYNGRYLSEFDLHKLTAGVSRELNLSAQSIQQICSEYVARKKQVKKIKLRWRSHKRSLGWVPFKSQDLKIIGDGKLKYYGKVFRFWQTVENIGDVRSGSFSQDAKGRWYINVVVEKPSSLPVNINTSVGVDLGIKTTATYSDGLKFEATKTTYTFAKSLAMAQRAKKKRRVTAIHAKIAKIRKDALHKETTRVVNTYDTIFVGNVSSTKLVKTKLAKSVFDASWGMYRSMLSYKAIRLGKTVVSVNESHSTVTCSNCLEKGFKSGLSTLGIREWQCGNCGEVHDRDINAAKNILRMGHHALKEETLPDGSGCQINKAKCKSTNQKK